MSSLPRRHRRTVEMPTVYNFFLCIAMGVLGRSEVECFPAQLALLTQNREGSKGIAAMQGDGMVQHMQNTRHTAIASADAGMCTSGCITLRKNASNISKVHKGAL